MPKALTAGNGELLVCFDEYAQVRDFYYPHVGLENHVGSDRRHRLAVFTEGQAYFLEDDFDVSISCAKDSLTGEVVAECQAAEVSLRIKTVVYNEDNIFLRRISVKNNADREREIKLFLCQEFQIAESHSANTAFYDPRSHTVIHYRGQRAFLINLMDEEKEFDEYTVGVYGIDGKSGSFVDVYDGQLSGNAIEHGPCDSCIGIGHQFAPGEAHRWHAWITAGTSIDEAKELDQYVRDKGPDHLIKTTEDYWHAWVSRRQFTFYGLSDEVVSLFKRSLFMIRSHVGANGGIIASGDSDMLQHGKDTYGYVWPRDGSYVAMALDRAGDSQNARKFFDFMADVMDEEGYFMHKYGPDKSLGSSWHPWLYDGEFQLPIQEDETATVLHALWNHYEISRDLEFIESIYNPIIRTAGEFLVSYRHASGLPKRSYDLWEERMGIHTYTASSVYGGLMACSKFARLLGKMDEARYFEKAGQKTRHAILSYLYNKDHFVRGGSYTTTDGKERFEVDNRIDMSSQFGVLFFGVLDEDDERLQKAFQVAQSSLWLKTDVGGVARYVGDDYYRERPDVPGNPWFITTLWMARYHVAQAKSEEDLEQVKEILKWVVRHARESGVLSEQLDPTTGDQRSAAPLTWSHAEFVLVVIAYLNKLEDLGICRACNPVD